MQVIIVTGLSGAGKSHAVNCLEDLGYYCVDNMPPTLIQEFLKLTTRDNMQIEKVAFVVDIRGGEFFDELRDALKELQKSSLDYKILFLEASDEALIRRYKETRRTHPLAGTGGAILEGIRQERVKLEVIRKMANYIIDTSNMKTAHLNEEIKNLLLSDRDSSNFTITVVSFGYKYGIPLDAEMVFDVRFIPNPFYLSSMRNLTGNSKKVQDYVMRFPETQSFAKRVQEIVEELIPSYIREGKYHLVLAFGCTGGHHRSVTLANVLSAALKKEGRQVLTIHRDL